MLLHCIRGHDDYLSFLGGGAGLVGGGTGGLGGRPLMSGSDGGGIGGCGGIGFLPIEIVASLLRLWLLGLWYRCWTLRRRNGRPRRMALFKVIRRWLLLRIEYLHLSLSYFML